MVDNCEIGVYREIRTSIGEIGTYVGEMSLVDKIFAICGDSYGYVVIR